ncbi:hypothetical protein BCR37DRAFT_378504 [Protomyces lactucae-debilis]|uniref:Pentacotripeptide-repeat region of PRORP domain-containing protein n=1 Tax=Protomyces lactucae-debilis TaxID=2754530 RepID=A0A1Y2FKI0_PROLT|nr:uncharacterized protein BCR37DRAFT_378504 [Protomyces lactucae-debilis]ORY84470.1 hypothetical protein BCR37DRAFT_378504 [Protomyces lactucae-debilis]
MILRRFASTASHVQTNESFWEALQSATKKRIVHPIKASQLMTKRLDAGFPPPETVPRDLQALRSIIQESIRAGRSTQAYAHIDMVEERGHISRFDLVEPIADDYIRCLLSVKDARGPVEGKQKPVSDLVVRKWALIEAKVFVAKLDQLGKASSISPALYDDIIQKMDEHGIAIINPSSVFHVAVRNKIPLNVRSWNVRLKLLANKADGTSRVLKRFKQMTAENHPINDVTIAIVLKALSKDPAYFDEAYRVLATAKQLKIWNVFIATEELHLLKLQYKHAELIARYTEYFGNTLLMQLGFVSLPKAASVSQQIAPLLRPSNETISLVLHTLVKLNPDAESLARLYAGFQQICQQRTELTMDQYCLSIFVRAFSKHESQIDRAIEILEYMRQAERRPSVFAYTHVIEGLCKSGAVDTAIKVLLYMQHDGVKPDAYTWTCLIRFYVEAGDYAKARSIYAKMRKLHCKPSEATMQAMQKIPRV